MTVRVIWTAMMVLLALTSRSSAQQAVPAVRLDGLFDGDLLHVQIPYLESRLGPAKRVSARADGAQWREYGIKGCVVYALVADNETKAFRARLSTKCTLDAGRILGGAVGNMSNVTFGALAPAFYRTKFLPSCIANCGNAADPVYSFWGMMPHVAEFLQVVVSSYDSEGATALSTAFRKTMSDDDISMGRYNCNANYDALATQAFRNARISEITIGYDLEPGQPKCD